MTCIVFYNNLFDVLCRHQGVGGFGNDGAAFGSLNMDQQLAGRLSAPATPNHFSSVGGNPFG